MAIFDETHYPHELREAQELLSALTDLFPKVATANTIAARAGLPLHEIFWEQNVFYVWKEVVEMASRWVKLRKLVEESVKLAPPDSPHTKFMQQLLANEPIILPAEPRGQDGAPLFIHSNDDITEPEALLYYDDLTIPIGRVSKLVKTLETLIRLATSVCRLTVEVSGATQYGTAFRIGEDTLLTNWHVLHNKDTGVKASAVTAEFGYEDDGAGGYHSAKNITCDINSIITSKENDWAIIRTLQLMDPEWEVVKLKDAATPVTEQSAFIIQHPLGNRKRVGFVRNQISFVSDRVVQYLTDTQVGSSGAPVFNENGELIALHHAAGRAQEVIGRSPAKKNEGIRISRIIADLRDKQIPGY